MEENLLSNTRFFFNLFIDFEMDREDLGLGCSMLDEVFAIPVRGRWLGDHLIVGTWYLDEETFTGGLKNQTSLKTNNLIC